MWLCLSVTGAWLVGPRGESQEVLRETPGGTSEKAGGAEAEGGEEEERCRGETQTEAQRRASESNAGSSRGSRVERFLRNPV